jgi:hypothetical protein
MMQEYRGRQESRLERQKYNSKPSQLSEPCLSMRSDDDDDAAAGAGAVQLFPRPADLRAGRSVCTTQNGRHHHLPPSTSPQLFHHRTQSFVFHAHDEIVLADDGTGGFSSQSNPCFDTSPA